MSEENVELVIRALRAVTRRPKPDFETVNALYHPEHVLVSLGTTVLGEGEAIGARGFKSWSEEQAAVMPFELEVEGAVDVGPDTVLVVTAVHFQGAFSGIETDRRIWNLVTVKDGKITRTEAFAGPNDALKAALRT